MQIYIGKSGQQTGPFSREQVEAMVSAGMIALGDSAWHEGMTAWQPLYEVLQLAPPPQAPPVYHQAVAAPNAQADFLYISISRLVVMSIVSLGLYEAYWIYRNWRYLKERDGLFIRPFWRGIFGVFFIHALLKAIKEDRKTSHIVAATFSPSALATGWIVLLLLGRVLSRAPDTTINLLGILLPTFCFFIPVQNYINALNEASAVRPAYYRFSGGHITCLVLGLIMWVLILAGLFLD